MSNRTSGKPKMFGKLATAAPAQQSLRIELRTTVATNAAVYRALLGDLPGLKIVSGPLLDGCIADAVIAPTNSFGYLDTGIDSAFARRFGPRLQRALQERIGCEFDSELPVGEAIIIPTGDFTMPFMIAAPATQLPGCISANPMVYSALRAAMRAISAWNIADEWPPIESIVLPDMATIAHGWEAETLVLQVREAIEDWNRESSLPGKQARAA
jgi:O-acetyl-ADP-ribose deacetylase (regulator of RNase III)